MKIETKSFVPVLLSEKHKAEKVLLFTQLGYAYLLSEHFKEP
jgi:hypothetical protein